MAAAHTCKYTVQNIEGYGQVGVFLIPFKNGRARKQYVQIVVDFDDIKTVRAYPWTYHVPMKDEMVNGKVQRVPRQRPQIQAEVGGKYVDLGRLLSGATGIEVVGFATEFDGDYRRCNLVVFEHIMAYRREMERRQKEKMNEGVAK